MEPLGEPMSPNPFLRQEGPTRQSILTLLKTKWQMNAGELAKELGITEMAIRRHLYALERDGLVKPAMVRQAMGRPTHMYSLTEEAEYLFPKKYHTLALDLLEELDEDPETALLVTRMFEGRKRKLLERYAGRMEGKSLPDRVRELALIQNDGGYMVQLEQEQDELVLHEYNCPIAQVASRYQQACECELDLFESLLGTKVARTECLAKGGSRCTYRMNRIEAK